MSNMQIKCGIILFECAENYRFHRIQEQCRLKWQATLDKFSELLKDHEKCLFEKSDLDRNLQHISKLWEEEKEMRRIVEAERNFYVSIFDGKT